MLVRTPTRTTTLLLAGICFAILELTCDCFEYRPRKSKFYDNEENSHVKNGDAVSIDNIRIQDSDVQELYFQQRLDHYSSSWTSRRKTFQQRYFYSKRFVSRGGSAPNQHDERPVYAFLCVGGEGPSLDSTVLIDSVHCSGDMIDLAKRLHHEEEASVHMYAIEHRYYGKSIPNLTTTNVDHSTLGNMKPFDRSQHYQYLSSRQALADIASFIAHQTGEILPSDTKWVTFGGSYPGVLSGWARYTFPHLIHAAVSSSAPLQAIVDFKRYKNAVAFQLSYDIVGGSNSCLEIIREGHKSLAKLLSLAAHNHTLLKRNREYVATLFHIKGGTDSLMAQRNLELFMGDGVIDIPFQDNDPSCSKALCNIEKICKAVTNYSLDGLKPVDILADIHTHQHGTAELDISWEHYLEQFLGNNTDPNDIAWTWQVCTEFGFFQTCEQNSDCPFARDFHPLSQDVELCKLLFDISYEDVKQNVQEILNWFGGWNIKGTRILFVNGDVDPWSQQAVTPDHGTQSTPWQPSILVKGASHHVWTHSRKESDTKEVNQAREIIHRTVTSWLRIKEEARASNLIAVDHFRV